MSRYKFDRSREFIPGYNFGGGHWRSVAVQAISKPEICHGAGFKLRADARVRVQRHNEFVLSAGAKAKSVTNNLPILSVLCLVANLFSSFVSRILECCLLSIWLSHCPYRHQIHVRLVDNLLRLWVSSV